MNIGDDIMIVVEENQNGKGKPFKVDNIQDFIRHVKMLCVPYITITDDNYIVDCLHHDGSLRIRFILSEINKNERKLLQPLLDYGNIQL